MKALITGTAGFIGFHLTLKLLERSDEVVGIDNINDYYDTNLKYGRLKETGINKGDIEWRKVVQSIKYSNYRFVRMNLEDKTELLDLCKRENFDIIVNLAAQPGVRYSLLNPDAYIQANIVGFLNILEAARRNNVKHLVYASSSSVYGLNEVMPFSVRHNVDHPISLYAASKKANELMAHSYSHLYNIPTSGLRFFTVYGPWGRPDMAMYSFTKSIIEGNEIRVFNHGKMKRDFTYIDDIVNGMINVIDHPATPKESWSGLNPDPASSKAPFRLYNIGNNSPVELLEFIREIEKATGETAKLVFEDIQDGDVLATWADVDDLIRLFNYQPATPVSLGVKKFVTWFKTYYKTEIA